MIIIDKIILQLTLNSFVRPEFFEKRIIYTFFDNDNPYDNIGVNNITVYSSAPVELKNIITSLLSLQPNSSTIFIRNSEIVEISYLNGNELISKHVGSDLTEDELTFTNNLIDYLTPSEVSI